MKRRVAPSGAQVPLGGLAPPNQQDMQTTLLTEPQGEMVTMAQNTGVTGGLHRNCDAGMGQNGQNWGNEHQGMTGLWDDGMG